MKLSKKANCLLCDLEGLIDYARDSCLAFKKIIKEIYDILSENLMNGRDLSYIKKFNETIQRRKYNEKIS